MALFERSNLVAYQQGGADTTRIAVRFNGLTDKLGSAEHHWAFVARRAAQETARAERALAPFSALADERHLP
jgi:hypothetical protein